MKNIGILFYVLLSIIIFGILPTYGAANVKINELSIDQSPQTIELINVSSDSADISNWYIDDNGGTTYYSIPQNTVLYPLSCLVFSSDFNLNKSSPDTVRLFNSTAPPTSSSSSLIDSYSYKSSPGLNSSYYRNPDGTENWILGISSIGTYNSTGQNCILFPSNTPTPSSIQPTPSVSLTPTQIINTEQAELISYENIFISEVMVYPDASQNEWIELCNNNEYDVSLVNWFIDDVGNEGATPKQFSINIASKNYAIVDFTSSIFNNNGDSIRLLDYEKRQKDGFEYKNPHPEKTWGRNSWNTDIFCEQEPSKYIVNNVCAESKDNNHVALLPSPDKTKAIHQPPYIASQLKTPVYNQVLTGQSQQNLPSVLGTSIQSNTLNLPPQNKALLQHLSVLSGSYSILTIISLLVKIKNGS